MLSANIQSYANESDGKEIEDGVKQEIHPKAFRLTLIKGHRQNEVGVQPNWFINRKAKFSLVEKVANKKGFRRSEKKSSHWVKPVAYAENFHGGGSFSGLGQSFVFVVRCL